MFDLEAYMLCFMSDMAPSWNKFVFLQYSLALQRFPLIHDYWGVWKFESIDICNYFSVKFYARCRSTKVCLFVRLTIVILLWVRSQKLASCTFEKILGSIYLMWNLIDRSEIFQTRSFLFSSVIDKKHRVLSE